MKHYELDYLISPDVTEEELSAIREKITSLIQAEGGLLDRTGSGDKKLLAYPIKSKNEAFLITLTFQSDPEKISGLEKELKSASKIIRYIILNKKPIKDDRLRSRSMKFKPKPKTKVELKEIEIKLEEILNEPQ